MSQAKPAYVYGKGAWVSPCTLPIVVHVCAATQHAKGPDEAKYRFVGVMIIKYSGQ